ncbi:hypothetical protein [Nostoc sp.]|uniref:hypothetical protein n=1 Tax=Nostoc sp. TaxID=1180 RepID=UPI002FF87B24
MLNTGIFQLLPYSAYHPQMNNFQNRLEASVSELYPFPSLGEAKGGFSLSLSFELLGVGFARRRHRITTSASGRRLKLLLAMLFFDEFSITYPLHQLNISRTI